MFTEGWKMVDNTRIVEAFRELPQSDLDSESDFEPADSVVTLE